MEMVNKTLRDAFFDRLYQLAREDEDVVLVVADMSAPSLDKYRKNLPSQFINVGIAEQNAILIASGLALAGKKVYVYAIASFITLRCFEQIRINNSIMGIPITIVGMGTAYSYFTDGPTHHLIEDISAMRSLPGINIYNPVNAMMAEKMADITYGKQCTNYIRLDRESCSSDVYKVDDINDEGIHEIVKGKDYVVASSGIILDSVKAILEKEHNKSLYIGLIDIYKYPINTKLLLSLLANKKKIITVEEHFLPGGLGSAVAEILIDNDVPIKLKRVGISHAESYKHSYQYGGRDVIRKSAGIDDESIENTITNFFK